MKKYLTLVGLSTLLLFTSCNKTSEVENYFNVKNTKGNEIVMLSDLYIASKGDTWALARILNTTPAVIERLKNGEVDALIGTHAILEDNVEFQKLGLVITDEQHRFGVRQRSKLSDKSKNVLKRTKRV